MLEEIAKSSCDVWYLGILYKDYQGKINVKEMQLDSGLILEKLLNMASLAQEVSGAIKTILIKES